MWGGSAVGGGIPKVGGAYTRPTTTTCIPLYILLHVCSIYLVFQTTMPQRSLSVYFSSPVPPLLRAKREDVIDTLLYFRFKDRITGHKRQKAYKEAQKACATLFLSVPMATRDRFR